MAILNPTLWLNTTACERSYTVDRSDGVIASIRRVLSRLWFQISNWGNEENASVERYQSTLKQLASHAAKTEILDTEKAERCGIEPKTGTACRDPRNLRAQRFEALDPKIQAFYQALKGRVELIEPYDSATQATLYRAGLSELIAKVSEPDMKRYVAYAFKQIAFEDLENKVTPQQIRYQQCIPLAQTVNCFLLTFFSKETAATRQKALCETVRKRMIKNHAEKFYAEIEKVIADGEKRIARKEARHRNRINYLENVAIPKLLNQIREKTSPHLLEQLSKARYDLADLNSKFAQIRANEEQRDQHRINDLILFTTEETADSNTFYELVYPE
jgi:hypothetical protein